MAAHYHVIRAGEGGNGKLGGRIFEYFNEALGEFLLLAPVSKRYLTEQHCRDVFARGKVVRLRDGDDFGGFPIGYFAECDDTSCEIPA